MMEGGEEEREGGARVGTMAREDFRKYYALGPGLEDREQSMGRVEDEEEREGEEEWRRRLEKDKKKVEKQRLEWRRTLGEGELSDDSGVKDGDESEEEEERDLGSSKDPWKKDYIPPDVVSSADRLKVVKTWEEGRRE